MKNFKRKYKLIACDIDGCLFDEIDQFIDLSLIQQIKSYNEAGFLNSDRPVITLCTGRPLPFAECVSRIIGNLQVPVISENGLWLHWPSTLAAEMDERVDESLRKAVFELEFALRQWLMPQGAIFQAGKTASISIIKLDDAWLNEHVTKIQKLCDEKKYPFHISRTWSCINCTLQMINKSTGMQRLLAKLGLDKSEVIGIGDTMADLGIAENVEVFCCPSNADEKIKPYATYVSPYKDGAGVVDILSWITKNFS